ncbi:GNAT family N-acetyltransferase [bacterium]|nr:GNAT family N-acetyltransferase [bacterium]
MIKIKEIDSKDFSRWDYFVESREEASFHHRIRWKMFIEKMYGNRLHPIYLMAYNSDIEAVLPLFIYKHRLFGKKLISIPFSTNGGCVSQTNDIEIQMIQQAIELTRKHNLDYLELRNQKVCPMDNLVTDDSYFTLCLPLENTFDVLQKKLRSTTKRYIRRAQENNLDINLFSEDLNGFYRLYALGSRDLGTPSLGFQYIKTLFTFFREYHQIATVYHKDQLIAAILLRTYRNTVSYVLGASIPEFRCLYPNYLLFAAVLKYFSEKGFKNFDFGRSVQSSGTYFFKLGWGAAPIQYHYQYYLHKIRKIPSTSQDNSRRKQFTKIWRYLPFSVADWLGPKIRRNYP